MTDTPTMEEFMDAERLSVCCSGRASEIEEPEETEGVLGASGICGICHRHTMFYTKDELEEYLK